MAILGGAKILLAIALLVASMVTDLRNRKVPNKLLGVALALFILFILTIEGVSGVWPAVGSFAAACICALPLYITRAMAGGDFKLIAVISLILPWEIAISMVLFSLVWGALLGVFQALLRGQLKQMGKNLISILNRQPRVAIPLHHIPFTVALFFGYLTAMTYNQIGGMPWL